ncbi:hypothetical protein [Lacinutrix cladophorae]
MAPIKFEENIKEKLEKRTLEPSANAWANLEQQLNTDSKKQDKAKFWWIGVAASFIGLLFVVQYFMRLDTTKSVVTPIVVASENENVKHAIEPVERIKKTAPIVLEQAENIPENKKVKSALTYKNEPANKAVSKDDNNIKKSINSPKRKPLLVNNIAIATKENETLKALNNAIKVEEEIVVSVTKITGSLKKEETQMTTLETTKSEIESLLEAANKKMQLTENHAVKSISVDANALLEDVETAMPPSLRGQLFKVIEKNFKTATTAVTNRNE